MLEDSTLTSLDWFVVGCSLSVSISIGLYFANKNKTFTDYARGGGDQNLIAVSVSMALAYCSALTMIGNASELYLHGSSFTILMATTLVGWPVSSFVLLPIFKRLNNVSVFEYLENRYNRRLRLFASVVYTLKMIFYTAITLYLPSLSLQSILGIPHNISIGITGFICVVCSTFGGLKGITWTNLYHSVLLVATMVVIMLAGTIKAGGLAALWRDGASGARLSPGEDYFSLDLTTRHTLYNTLIAYLPVRIFLHGASQSQVQSALSLSSLKRSQTSQLLSAFVYLLIQMLASACGLVLYSQYKDCDPFESGEINRRDAILMHYLSTKLNHIPAIQGLFIAAVFSATFSSVSAFQSACSAMIIEDFVRPAFERNKRTLDDDMGAKLGKLVSCSLGITCVALTFQMHKIDGLIQATTYIFSIFGVPILIIFLLGILTRFCNSIGAFTGMSCAILVGLSFLVYRMSNGPSVAPSLVLSTAGCPASATNPYVNLMIGNATVHGLLQNATAVEERELEADEAEGDRNDDGADGDGDDDDDDLVEISMTFEVVENELPPKDQKRAGGQNQADNILLNISYLWTPLFCWLTALIVTAIVSWLTGGCDHFVDEIYLSSMLHDRGTNRHDSAASSINLARDQAGKVRGRPS